MTHRPPGGRGRYPTRPDPKRRQRPTLVYLPKHTVDGLDREATQRGFDSRSALLREVLDRHLKDTGRN